MKKHTSVILLLLLAVVFLGTVMLVIGLGNGQGWTGMVRDYQDLYARYIGRYVGPGRITMEKWPAYDPDFRLDAEEEITKEKLAYYIATKLPDEYKNEDTLIYGVRIFDAVVIKENPEYDGPISAEHPLQDTEAVQFDREAIGIDARIDLSFGTPTDEVFTGEEKRLFDEIWNTLINAFPEESGVVWRKLDLSVTINDTFPIEGATEQWRTVPAEEYAKAFPAWKTIE